MPARTMSVNAQPVRMHLRTCNPHRSTTETLINEFKRELAR